MFISLFHRLKLLLNAVEFALGDTVIRSYNCIKDDSDNSDVCYQFHHTLSLVVSCDYRDSFVLADGF